MVRRPAAADLPAAALAGLFTGYGPLVGRLLDEIGDHDPEPFPHVTHRIPSRWGRGAATLLGDAAHAFPPTQAQGANQALEDAWLLSRTLRAAPAALPAELRAELPAALRRYEAARSRRVRRVAARAATERTNKPLPWAVRTLTARIPPRLVGLAYTAQLRTISNVLSDR